MLLSVEEVREFRYDTAAIYRPGERMAWTESYHCDVCNTPRNDAGDWWLAWSQEMAPGASEARQPMLRLTPWTPVLSQSAEVKHLCGARCAQTMMDRWMAGAVKAEAASTPA